MDIKSIWQKLDQISESAASKTTDMKNKKCTACKKGTYQETDQHDDMDGVLHCDKCNKEVKRHQPADSKKKDVKESLNEFAPSPGYPGNTSIPNNGGGSGGNFGGSGSGGGGGGDDDGDDEREFRVIITLYDDSAYDDETAERKVGINVFATNDEKACTKARIMLMNSDRFDGSRITNMAAKPVERPDYSDDLDDDDDLYEQDVAEGKWNYPPEYTKKANADDEAELGVSLINKDARKAWRKKQKAKAHKDLMTGKKKESDVSEGEMSSRKTDKGETIRKHTAKAGGYGRQIDTDDESGDKFHSTDFDDDKPKRKKKTQGRRGAPEKNADPETGNAKNYDTETLSRWIIGNLPKNLDKIGKTSVKHKLKEYMKQVESNNLTESIITEGKVKELASVLQDINHGHIDINDLITGKYSPTSEIEAFVASKLKEKYDEVAQDNQLSPEDDSQQIYEIILSELHDIMSGNDIEDNYSGEYADSDVSNDMDLDEAGQVTMEPAQTNTQVIKQDNKVLGQVTNPQLASTIKQAIGTGQMTLAGNAIKEGRITRRKNKITEDTHSEIIMESTLDEVIANYPHEHKMCQEGWGMDESMFSALCDHYHKDGRIPRDVWHGPMDKLRDHVEQCYLQDTQPLMGEDELEEDGTFTDIGQVAGTVLGAEGGPVGSAVGREVGGAIGGKIDDALAEDPLDSLDEMDDVLDEEYMEEDGYDALGNPTARPGKEAHDLGYSHAQQGVNKNPHAPAGPTYAAHTEYNQGQEAYKRNFGEELDTEDQTRSMLDEFDSEYEKTVSAIGQSANHTRDFATDDQLPVSRDPIRGLNPYKEYTMESKMNKKTSTLRESRINELDKSTLGSYVKKSSADATKRQSKVTGHNEFQKGARTMAGAVYGDKVQKFPDRKDPKIAKRQAGVDKAVDRMTREKNVDEAISQDEFDQAAIGRGKRGRDARDNPKKTVALAKQRNAAEKSKTNARNRNVSTSDVQLDEKFDKEAKINPAKKGMFKGKTKEELKSQLAKLKASGPHKLGSKENTKMKELQFAIRAKSNWGPIDEGKVSQLDSDLTDLTPAEFKKEYKMTKAEARKKFTSKATEKKKVKESTDFLSWDKQLMSLINEDLTVNITKSSTPGSNSVNVSATGEESEMLMKLIQSAGLGGAELGQSQYRQPSDDAAAVTVEPVMHDEVIGSLGDDDIDDGEDSMAFLKHMVQHGQGPVDVAVVNTSDQFQNSMPDNSEECDDDYEQEIDENEMEDDEEEVCPECDGEGCPECYGEEDRDRAHDHAQGMERESVEMDEDEMEEGAGVMHLKNQQAKQSGEKSFKLGDKTFPVKEEDEMEEGAGVMHFKDEQAKKAGKKSFKLGGKTFPVKEADDVNVSGNGDNSEEADEEKSDATRDAGLAASYTPEGLEMNEHDIVKRLMEKLNKIDKKSTKCNECGSMMTEDHKCSTKKLDEWANSPVGQSEDEQFQTDTDFMTKVISGGLNNIKQDQTTLGQGPVRVKTAGEIQDVNLSMGAMLRKLDGIN